ncbi:alpha/beta hydrolase [Patescibacteria group bacterium]|nr:alpha/beta hydrolase [Patescibacteria group bacterium]MBU1934480.1 alpha/beta hydrolase [Patescibacteria group bacterium]
MTKARVNGIDIWYDRYGEGNRTVLFLHAFAVTSKMWNLQITPLVNAGFKVICVDLRGHGKSSTPPGPYSLFDLVNDIHLLIDSLSLQNVCLVGLSTGGRVSIKLALSYPNDISELVLVSTKSEPALDIRSELKELSDIAFGGDVISAVNQFYSKHYQRLSRAAPELVNKMLASWRNTGGEGFTGVANAITEMESVTSSICQLKMPALAIAGQLDPSCHPFLAWYERTMINCRGIIIPDSGHFVNVEQPTLFNEALISFLNDQNKVIKISSF